MADDSRRAPFVAVTDYDRRVLRGLTVAALTDERRYVWVRDDDLIVITRERPADRVCTVCTPGGVAVNISAEADENLIPED